MTQLVQQLTIRAQVRACCPAETPCYLMCYIEPLQRSPYACHPFVPFTELLPVRSSALLLVQCRHRHSHQSCTTHMSKF